MNHYDNDGLVICQVCGKSFHFITSNHLIKSHKITTKEYREKYQDVPMAKKDYYKTLKSKKNISKIMNKQETFEPIIEELNFVDKINDNSFKESQSIIDLAEKHKVPITERSSDPMDDKIRIIAYLKLSFPDIKDNYMFRKKKPDGTIEYQLITDMADPSSKIIFDFPNSFWHNEQIGVSRHIRNQLFKSLGWKIVEINSSMPKVSHIELKLKKQ